MSRCATCDRKTKETNIHIELNIDGTGQYDIQTGVGFFDHMLEGFARHGLFDLTVRVEGDTHVDAHHTVEDTGIGIRQGDIVKLFVEFERIEERRNRNIEGTGLGMNIVVKLLKMMDSYLDVDST